MGHGGEAIERRAHGERPVRCGINQRQVNGDAARMGRSLSRIGKENRVGGMFPQFPLGLRRAEGIEDAKSPALPGSKADGANKQRLGIGVQLASGPGINGLASEVVRRRIGDRQFNIMGFGCDFDQRHLFSDTLLFATETV